MPLDVLKKYKFSKKTRFFILDQIKYFNHIERLAFILCFTVPFALLKFLKSCLMSSQCFWVFLSHKQTEKSAFFTPLPWMIPPPGCFSSPFCMAASIPGRSISLRPLWHGSGSPPAAPGQQAGPGSQGTAGTPLPHPSARQGSHPKSAIVHKFISPGWD